MKKLILIIMLLVVVVVIAGCPKPGESVISDSDDTIESSLNDGEGTALAGQAISSSRPVKVKSCTRTARGISITNSANAITTYNNGCVGQNLRAYSCVDASGRVTARATAYVTRTDNCDGRGCANGQCNPAPAPQPPVPQPPAPVVLQDLPLFYDFDLDGSVTERDMSCVSSVANGDRACLRVPERRLAFDCTLPVSGTDSQTITRLWFDRALPATVPDANRDLIPDCMATDSDGDGVAFKDDNCPAIVNADQADADRDGVGDVCDSDQDGDGVANAVDNCPAIVNADQADVDRDGVGDVCDQPVLDSDGDGIFDDQDNCPRAINVEQLDTDRDGAGNVCDTLPWEDIDNDTVHFYHDNCDLTPNPNQEDSNRDGRGDACSGDPDQDGRLGFSDNCPAIANPDQLDTNRNGIGDACDPNDPCRPLFGYSSYTNTFTCERNLIRNVSVNPYCDGETVVFYQPCPRGFGCAKYDSSYAQEFWTNEQRGVYDAAVSSSILRVQSSIARFCAPCGVPTCVAVDNPARRVAKSYASCAEQTPVGTFIEGGSLEC